MHYFKLISDPVSAAWRPTYRPSGSRTARALGHHERLGDADAESLTHEALIEAGFAEEVLDGTWQPRCPARCDPCKGAYKGRVPIFQVMAVSDEIQRIIMRGGNAIEITRQACLEGVGELRQAGLLKVKQGLTTPEEVMAVTN